MRNEKTERELYLEKQLDIMKRMEQVLYKELRMVWQANADLQDRIDELEDKELERLPGRGGLSYDR